MKRHIHRYGWHRDRPDHRDRRYSATAPPHNLPRKVDLRDQMPPVYDQGNLGSCTANAIAAAFEHARRRAGQSMFRPSRLFLYFAERELEGNVGQDSGAQLRDGVKVLANLGVPPEKLWPYSDRVPGPFTARPFESVYVEAARCKGVEYFRVPRILAQMKACLASGTPFTLGMSVPSAFEDDEVARTGVLPMPAAGTEVLGGHAMLVVGYDDDDGVFLVRNSWGAEWGLEGYVKLPQGFVVDPSWCDDFWALHPPPASA